jgi:putative PIN family toxin of toxin-antitoxin system
MRVVFDTNVLVAALRSRNGASFRLISMIPTEQFQTVLSIPLYAEYRDVLSRPGIMPQGILAEDIQDFIDNILINSQTNNIYYLWRHTLGDRKDDMILELAVAAAAEYIVTFNEKDFKNIELFGIEVITPGAFLGKLELS